MKATQQLHEMGQSLWLDNITRGLLTSGTLRRYIQEFSVTGLTSNPTIFDHAIKNSHDYDDGIRQKLKEGKSGEALFFELAIEDLTAGRRSLSADPRRDQRRRRLGVAGGLAHAGPRHREHHRRGAGTSRAGGTAQPLHQDSRHPRGPPGHRGVNLRRCAGQRDTAVLRASNTWRRPRRTSAASNDASPPGLNPQVGSVASLFVSRWDVAIAAKAPASLLQPARYRGGHAYL